MVLSKLAALSMNAGLDFLSGNGKAFMGFTLLSLVFYGFYASASLSSVQGLAVGPITGSSSAPSWPNWAQYTPFVPATLYRAPPKGCSVTQVNIIQRHGARFPTKGAGAKISSALEKLQAVQNYTESRLDFLKNFTYNLGTDDLVPFGASQSSAAGVEAFERYSDLVSDSNIPFVRASSSERVVFSATNWTAGFAAASEFRIVPKLSVILSEAGNDTLDDNMCPSAGDSSDQTAQWLAVFASPIAIRLNAAAPGANLTVDDVSSLISLCPFETLAKERHSAFCDLFKQEPDAFPGFAYSGDLDKYYGTGYGQPLGRVQGVGYVNELLARLTNSPVQDRTQTNRTLDSAPATFPLNRTLYADFSHDNQMIAIYAAMGLFQQDVPLDPVAPDPQRSWRAVHLVPFSARMITERLQCAGGAREGEYVRVLVNDAVQPLEFCSALDGVCALDAFVKSQEYARNNGEGDFEKCFE